MRVDPNYVSGLVGSLNDATLSQQTLSTELSSGLRVASASDDPVAAGQASLLGSANWARRYVCTDGCYDTEPDAGDGLRTGQRGDAS